MAFFKAMFFFAFMWGDRIWKISYREGSDEQKLDWVYVEFLMTAEGIVWLTAEILKSLRLKLYL